RYNLVTHDALLHLVIQQDASLRQPGAAGLESMQMRMLAIQQLAARMQRSIGSSGLNFSLNALLVGRPANLPETSRDEHRSDRDDQQARPEIRAQTHQQTPPRGRKKERG